MRLRQVLSVILFVTAIVPYCLAIGFSFINIDDPQYFVTPEIICQGISVRGLVWAFTDLSNAIWMPLIWIVYQLDYTLRDLIMRVCPSLDGFQVAYSIAHVQSLALHGLNAVLLFGFLRRLAPERSVWLPFLGALLWAVHPLRTESVVWIASFKDVLSMTFLLLALSSWVDFRREGDYKSSYWRSHVWFVLACCSKPSVMTFPAMIWLIDTTVLGRFSFKQPRWADWRVYMPSFAMALAVAIVAQIAQTMGGATGHQATVPFWYKALNALVSIGVYVRNALWPTQLAVQCQIQWPRLPHFFLAGSVIGGIVVVCAIAFAARVFLRLRKGFVRDAFAGAGLLWGLGTILPMLGLSAFGGHAFADRFTYIPFVGVSIAMVALCQKRMLYVFLGMVAFGLGTLTVRQTGFWKDDGMLMTRTLEIDGDQNVLAHLNMARYLYEHRRSPDDVRDAARHFASAYAQNQSLSQSSTVIYLMTLGECGQTEDFPRIQLDFIRWIREKHGIWNSADHDITDGLCDLYCPKGDRSLAAERARRLAHELLAEGEKGVFQLDYYIYLTGKLTGDVELEKAGYERLRRLANPETGIDSAIRFRFVYEQQACN